MLYKPGRLLNNARNINKKGRIQWGMQRSIVLKKEKLLRVDVEYEGVIRSVKITGDFFLTPNCIEDIESACKGTVPNAALEEKLNQLLKQKSATLIGITSADIVEALRMATQ